jgi:hypothetical protein
LETAATEFEFVAGMATGVDSLGCGAVEGGDGALLSSADRLDADVCFSS